MTIDLTMTRPSKPHAFNQTAPNPKLSIPTRNPHIEPIFIRELALPRGKLLSKKTLVFHPSFDEKNRTFFIIDYTLGIDVFAQTRDGLLKELEEVIPVLWNEYATADSDLLTTSAQELKRSLHETFKEHDYAA